jgi:hypothetical protein
MEGLFKALTGLFLILMATGIKAAAPPPMDHARFTYAGAMDTGRFTHTRGRSSPALTQP